MSDQQAKITISAEEQGVSQVLKTVEALEKRLGLLEKQLKSYDAAIGKTNSTLASQKTATDDLSMSTQKLYSNIDALMGVQQGLGTVGTRTNAVLASQASNMWSLSGTSRKVTVDLNAMLGAQNNIGTVGKKTNSVLAEQSSNLWSLSGNAKGGAKAIRDLADAQERLNLAQKAGMLGASGGTTVGTRTNQPYAPMSYASTGGLIGSTNYGLIGPPSMKGPTGTTYGTGGGQNGPYMFGFPTASQVAITEKANAEYERLYGNTAKLKQAHQEASQAVDKHTSSWGEHIAKVAGGIILYQGVREAMRLAIGFFYGGIKAVSDYEDAIIGMAAMWTTLAKDQSNIPETFKLNVQYAKDLIPVMQQIDIYSGMNLDQLLQMNMAFATQGVVLNKNNQDQIQGYTNISNAILFLTKGQSSSRQIQQEIKAVMQGQLRDSDSLAKILASQIGPEYKKQIADWKAIGQASGDSGFIIAKIGEHLKGYTEAMDMMQGSWSVMISSLKTTWTILERDVFTPILKDWKIGLQAVNEYLKAHSTEIATNVYNAWISLKGVLVGVYENWDNIKVILEVIFGVMALQRVVTFVTWIAKLGPILTEIVTTLGTLEIAIGAGAIATGAVTVGSIATAFVAVGIGIYYAIEALQKWNVENGNPATRQYTHPTDRNAQSINPQSPDMSRFKNGDFIAVVPKVPKPPTLPTGYTPKLGVLGTDDNSKPKVDPQIALNRSWEDLIKKIGDLNSKFASFNERGGLIPTIEDAVKSFDDAKSKVDSLNVKGITPTKERIHDLQVAFEDQTKAEGVYEKSFKHWNSELDKADKMLTKSTATTLTLTEARKKVSDAELHLQSVTILGTAAGSQLTDGILKLTEARNEEAAAAKAGSVALDKINKKFKFIGDTATSMFGEKGGSAASAFESYSILSDKQALDKYAENNGMTTGQAQANLYSSIGDNIGKIVGGKTGGAISATSSGGVLGLTSFLISSAKAEKAERNDARRSGYDSIISSALSGGEYSAMLARGGGYTYGSMESWTGAGAIAGKSAGQRLFGDRGTEGMENLTKYVKVMDEALASISAFAKPSLVTQLDAIRTKYEYSIATAGNLAELHKAYIADITVAITGITADSVAGLLEDVVTTSPTGEAGAAFAEKMEASLATSIRNISELTFSQSVIIPALQPGLSALAQAVVAGADTSAIYAGLKGTIQSLVPVINEFQGSLESLGLSSLEMAKAVKAEADTLIKQAYQVLGNTEALRSLALADISPENQALQQLLWAQQDAAQSVTDSLNGLRDSVVLQKDALTAAYDSSVKLISTQETAWTETLNRLNTLQNSLKSTLSGFATRDTGAMAQRAAQGTIYGALNTARAGGEVTLDSGLQNALSVVSQMKQSDFSSQVEYSRAYYGTMYAVQELSGIIGEQITVADQQLTALESIRDILTLSYDNSNTALDNLVKASEAQAKVLLTGGLTDAEKAAYQTAVDTAKETSNNEVNWLSKIVDRVGDVDAGITGTEGTNTVLETIKAYQTTYENSLNELNATNAVNASVAGMNTTLATMSANLTAYDSTMYGIMQELTNKYNAEEALKRENIAAAAEAARLAAVAEQERIDAANKLAYENSNAFQLSGKNGATTNIGVGSYNVQDLFGWKGLTGFDELQGKFKIDLYIDPGLIGYRASYSASEGWSRDDWSDPRALENVESFTISRLPGFAVGTDYVPQDMIAQIHEGEKITPKAYNGENEKLMEELIDQVKVLITEVKNGNKNTNDTRKAVQLNNRFVGATA